MYKYENVIAYKYVRLTPEIELNIIKNINATNNAQIYLILDCPGDDAFAHWVFETFIFFKLFEKNKSVIFKCKNINK